MSMDQLDADALFSILAFTDVSTIISLSRVNRYLREISSSRSAWVSVILDLSSRRLIDLPFDAVEGLSTDALKDEVKRAVAGPRTWSPISLDRPTLLRQQTVPLQPHSRSDPSCAAHIIAYVKQPGEGGNFRGTAIQCLDGRTGCLLWNWTRPRHTILLAKFDFRGPSAAVVAIASFDERFSYHIMVLEVDLKTGESHEMLALRTGTLVASRLHIFGDYIACNANPYSVCTHAFQPLKYLTHLGGKRPSELDLCPGHLMVAYGVLNAPQYVHLYSFLSLDGLWRPMSELDFASRFNATPIRPSLVLELPGNILPGDSVRRELTTTFLPSLMHTDTYELISEVVDFVSVPMDVPSPVEQPFAYLRSLFRASAPPPAATPPPSSRTIQLTARSRHHLILPTSPSTPPHFTFKSLSHRSSSFSSISGAGYGMQYANTKIYVQRLDSTESAEPREFSIPGTDEPLRWISMTHSGAVLATTY
ncbi:hypothetical protein B0H14DRAFT_2762093 [Mycena olivaceomarginata]|nr:hypothetical protein B0H14DRAFT_2762093 [Mycena olivaceomarginata]